MKLLIAVGESPNTDTPPPAVAALLDAATEIRVLSPSLVGPLQWLTGEIDNARRVVEERLNDMLGRFDSTTDATVTAVRGDELVGTALSEALSGFNAEHVLLVAASSDKLWRRRKVLDRLLHEYV